MRMVYSWLWVIPSAKEAILASTHIHPAIANAEIMDKTSKISFRRLEYYVSPIATTGIPFATVTIGLDGESLTVQEAEGWRTKANPTDIPYLDAVLESYREASGEAEAIFDEMRNMSGAPLRLVEEG